MPNKLSPEGAWFLRLHEGFISKWYLDPVGIPTIGIGFTWRSAAFREWWKRNKRDQLFARGATMTREEAEDALVYLCEHEYGKAVNKFLGKKVAQYVFDGMVSPIYNLGPGALEWAWAVAVKRGDLKYAAKRLRVTGITAQGRELPGLVRRRKEEALLLEKGIYTDFSAPHIPPAYLQDAMSDGILRRGERGPAVRQLIEDLATLGFYDGAMDGVFGYGTEVAVMHFQSHHSLTRDGVAGSQTLEAIKNALPASKKPSQTTTEPSGQGGFNFFAWLVSLFTKKGL